MNKIVFTPGLWYSGNLPGKGQVKVTRGEGEESWTVRCGDDVLGTVSDRAELEHRFGPFTEVEVN